MKQAIVHGNGPGTCRVCGRMSGFSEYEVKAIDRRVKTEPLTVVAASVGVHPSSLRRHVLNHTNRPQIVRDVRLDEDRSAHDLVDDLIEQYRDANRIRIEALTKGEYAVSLRASNAARAIARQLLEELAVNADTLGTFTADTEALLVAVREAARSHPVVAKLLAQHATGTVREGLTDLYQRYAALTKENAA
jgi:AcrR family transcriptional regulator